VAKSGIAPRPRDSCELCVKAREVDLFYATA
jgi:hypothetical protein